MASTEMTDAEFLAFNNAWMAAVLPYLCDGGVFGSFIDWRGSPTVHSAATKLGLVPLNLNWKPGVPAGVEKGSIRPKDFDPVPTHRRIRRCPGRRLHNISTRPKNKWPRAQS
jgi:hypothetical protein